uniref:Serpentine Receptor, class T n=1 Tax=Haemonchus contortus TaxID=6289 RepID=A0A7I5EC43_HAECO
MKQGSKSNNRESKWAIYKLKYFMYSSEMEHLNCSIPADPFVGSARIIYVASCIVIIIVSIALQTIFVLTCQKMKGWKSDFAFYLLQLMAIFSILSYIGFLLSYIHGLFLFDSPGLAKITGCIYQAGFFAFVISSVCLTVHRLFYTLLPLRSHVILTRTVEMICIASITLFYIVYVLITLTPLASLEFCPAVFFFYSDEAPLQTLSVWMDRLFNYAVGVVNVTAYTIIFITLFLKGSLTFKRNSEIRMTFQAALVSACELFFFLYWEHGRALPELWLNALDGYSMIIYYDVLILPYMILNETVRAEMKNLFCKQKLRTSIVPSVDRSRSTLRQRQGV